MKITSTVLMFILSCFISGHAWTAEAKDVIVTIKPLHSLVSGVLGESGKARLLLEDNTSPHDFHLKPSQVKALHQADLVFYIDDSFETFLRGTFKTLPKKVKRAAVGEKAGLTLLAYRKGGAWDAHEHEHETDHEEHHDDEEKEHVKKEHHSDHDDHGDYDMHVWLDPENARKIVKFIAKELSVISPSNQDLYEKNANKTIAKIDALDKELKETLSGLQGVPFIVFHDAYQYFERAYSLNAVGSIVFEPDESPSARRIKEVREKLQQTKVKCILREPQFSDRLVKTVKEGTDARIGTIDPLGADLDNGQTLYFALMRNLASNLKQCLK